MVAAGRGAVQCCRLLEQAHTLVDREAAQRRQGRSASHLFEQLFQAPAQLRHLSTGQGLALNIEPQRRDSATRIMQPARGQGLAAEQQPDASRQQSPLEERGVTI